MPDLAIRSQQQDGVGDAIDNRRDDGTRTHHTHRAAQRDHVHQSSCHGDEDPPLAGLEACDERGALHEAVNQHIREEYPRETRHDERQSNGESQSPLVRSLAFDE